jgi:hypothetical protein
MFERIPDDKATQSAQIARDTAHYLAKGGTITECVPCTETWLLYAVANGDEGINLRRCKTLPDLAAKKARNKGRDVNSIQRAAYQAARESGSSVKEAKNLAKQAVREDTRATI